MGHRDLRAEVVRVSRRTSESGVVAGTKGAYARTQLIEQMAEIYYRARPAGEPVTPNFEQMADVAAEIHDYGQTKPSTSEPG